MNFRTRPHFEDRQIVQYLDENITLSGITNIAPIVLNFSGTTTAETAVTISELTGYLQGSKLSGFVVQPPILLQSGTTATTTTNVENFVLKALDQYGSVGWAPISGVSWSVSACTSPLNVTNILLPVMLNLVPLMLVLMYPHQLMNYMLLVLLEWRMVMNKTVIF
jgi:hypothetical protein